MPDTNEVEVRHEGPITIIRINRPQVRNAINKMTATALRKAWMDFEADENALAGILTGGDEVFCAGADLHDINQFDVDIEGPGPLGFTRLFVSKPTIAAIAGYCVAGGLELACWCDLRIADESAIFGCFERRFGVPLIDGGTQRLPRIIGLGRALEMILTGRAVPANEALDWGLANEVVPRGQSLQRAMELAHMLAQFPQTAMRNDRQAAYQGLGKDLAEGLRQEARLGADTLNSGEAAEGAKQFQQGKGRKGDFSA
ncbi:MAG TPA: crotonase/enoyl-CoA hydratase family protein [Ktedonobacteraceae bacterium]|nr:crotonase/enoyl-CoA hydratase family protein [Ktedonobacteraceae bacterium]